jgi:hypothetical protein
MHVTITHFSPSTRQGAFFTHLRTKLESTRAFMETIEKRKEKINSFVYKNFEKFREGVIDFFENSHRWETALYALLTLKFRVMGY